MDTRAGAIRRIYWYLYLGLAFLLWENTVGALLGDYHFEIRRTLWGLVFYAALFLLFGLLTEILNSLYSHLHPQRQWFGQRHLWFITILAMFLLGGIARHVLNPFWNPSSGLLSPFNPLWIGLCLFTGWLVNLALARLTRRDSSPSSPTLTLLYFSSILYLIFSLKVGFHYYHFGLTKLSNLALQPAFLAASLLTTWLFIHIMRSSWQRWIMPLLAPVLVAVVAQFATTELHPQNDARRVPAAISAPRPNIIIMLFDALRDDQVGPQGQNPSLTPAMDRLAAAGRRYPMCRSVTSWTYPSVSSLLTSRLPHKLGLIGEKLRPLPEGIASLTTVMHDHGYYTAGLSSNPFFAEGYDFRHLFQDFKFLPPPGSPQLFLPLRTFLFQSDYSGESAYQLGFCSTDLSFAPWSQINRRAVKLMEGYADDPFLFYLHYMEPHAPYWTKPFHEGLLNFEQIKMAPYLFNRYAAFSPEGKTLLRKNEARMAKSLLRRYQDGVETADQAVADMLQHLERLGLADNTIIIITSDHGEEFMEHGHYDHRNSLFDESVRIPLIIYLPEALHRSLPEPAGSISQVDIAPTILDLAGVDAEIPNSDGLSLFRRPEQERRPVFLAFEMFRRFWQGVVADNFKLMIIENQVTGKCDTLFYDLAGDPREKTNLYPCDSAVLDSLIGLLQSEFRKPWSEYPEESVQLTPEERERLHALGYIY